MSLTKFIDMVNLQPGDLVLRWFEWDYLPLDPPLLCISIKHDNLPNCKTTSLTFLKSNGFVKTHYFYTFIKRDDAIFAVVFDYDEGNDVP